MHLRNNCIIPLPCCWPCPRLGIHHFWLKIISKYHLIISGRKLAEMKFQFVIAFDNISKTLGSNREVIEVRLLPSKQSSMSKRQGCAKQDEVDVELRGCQAQERGK